MLLSDNRFRLGYAALFNLLECFVPSIQAGQLLRRELRRIENIKRLNE